VTAKPETVDDEVEVSVTCVLSSLALLREMRGLPNEFFPFGTVLMQFFQFVIFMSLFTSSFHLFLGPPSDLVNAGDHSYTFSTMLLSGIRCTCTLHKYYCTLIFHQTLFYLSYLNTKP
jgi:hypothetical protein